jgi:competence ComEA-like helix-hairpin-helix protein
MHTYAVATANEKKALWFLALVALSGSAVRLWRSQRPAPPAAEAAPLERQLERVDSVRALHHTQKSGDPPKSPAPARSAVQAALVDLDRATSEEIEALPGIGPALSKRIVAARDSSGAFGQIEALCAVNGVGPALIAKLRPLVTFTSGRRPLSDACGEGSKRPRRTRVSGSRQPR